MITIDFSDRQNIADIIRSYTIEDEIGDADALIDEIITYLNTRP